MKMLFVMALGFGVFDATFSEEISTTLSDAFSGNLSFSGGGGGGTVGAVGEYGGSVSRGMSGIGRSIGR